MNFNPHWRRCHAFALVEVLFALSILGFLVLGASALSMRYRTRLQSLAEIQDLGAVRLALEDWLVRVSPSFIPDESRVFGLSRDGDGMLLLSLKNASSDATRQLILTADGGGKPILHCVYTSGSQEFPFLLPHVPVENKARPTAR